MGVWRGDFLSLNSTFLLPFMAIHIHDDDTSWTWFLTQTGTGDHFKFLVL
jgi:hypothetical protein